MHPFARWIRFNVVGAGGVVIQLAVLAILLRAGVHYLVATALAVEAAIIANFLWHERWTWRDRPVHTRLGRARRLARFHLMNGTISIAGNMALMAALTGHMGVPPLAANAVAILACSVVNFFAGDVLVFRPAATVSAARS